MVASTESDRDFYPRRPVRYCSRALQPDTCFLATNFPMVRRFRPPLRPRPRTTSPRDIGIAYSPSPKNGFLRKLTGGPGNSSIRSGYGRFFTAIEGLTTSYQTGNPPYGLQYRQLRTPSL